jgi:hypothetical protein
MRKFAEGPVRDVIWGVRFNVATGLRWVADKVHEDLRYRVSGCTYRLVPGEGVVVEWDGKGVPLLYNEKDHELFHPVENRWADSKEVKQVAKQIEDQLIGRKWTQAQIEELKEALNL